MSITLFATFYTFYCISFIHILLPYKKENGHIALPPLILKKKGQKLLSMLPTDQETLLKRK